MCDRKIPDEPHVPFSGLIFSVDREPYTIAPMWFSPHQRIDPGTGASSYHLPLQKLCSLLDPHLLHKLVTC